MHTILTENAPAPGGHYSQAVVHAGLVYVSGTLPLDPISGQPVTGEIEAQAERALENLKAVLEAAGSGLDCVLKVTVYVSDMAFVGARQRRLRPLFWRAQTRPHGGAGERPALRLPGGDGRHRLPSPLNTVFHFLFNPSFSVLDRNMLLLKFSKMPHGLVGASLGISWRQCIRNPARPVDGITGRPICRGPVVSRQSIVQPRQGNPRP